MKKSSPQIHTGLFFIDCDFHVHTPGSVDYKDKKVKADDIVQAAITAGLDAICITDHNTADWVDFVAKAAIGTKLTVFPGTEISVTGGKQGPVHIVAIFDKGTSAEDIGNMLSSVGLNRSKRGDTDQIAEGDPCAVMSSIAKHGGIAIAAHADSSHGILNDMKGQPRIRVVKSEHLFAAELTKPSTADFLNGTDPNYQRALATYQASDAHTLAEIGTRHCYFKVASPTLEALRQCFLDFEVRICTEAQFQQSNQTHFPRVLSLSIGSGFFENQILTLHPSQNCLIGGQGVGKSLLIECLRFVLDQVSSIDEIRTDNEGKISSQVGLGGTVETVIQLGNGTHYRIRRTFDGRKNPIEVENIDSGSSYTGDLSVLFPIIAYSQTEAVQISRNENAQLQLIDRFTDAYSIQNRIETLLDSLNSSDSMISGLIHAGDELRETTKNLQTTEEALANVEKAMKTPILAKMKKAEKDKRAFQAENSYHKELSERLIECRTELEESYAPYKLLKSQKDRNQYLADANKFSKNIYSNCLRTLKTISSEVDVSRKKVGTAYTKWKPSFDATQKRYQKFLESQGGSLKALNTKRNQLNTTKSELQSRIKRLKAQATRLKNAWDDRNELLDKLDDEREQLFTTRESQYARLTQLSEGKIRLRIEKAADTSAFTEALRRIATGTRIRKNDLTLIGSKISPRSFVTVVTTGDAERISEQAAVELDTAKKFITWLNGLEDQEAVMSLQHHYLPEDKPTIEFRKSDGKYYPISEVSMGQRCTALMIIALTAGDFPIIIDQPEESIDIASVFSDVVASLRNAKHGRQFVLTTHNPNIAVTADSDLIHVLKASATAGMIVNLGAIEDESVRREVIEHLEGGEKPYLVRGRKYGLLH